LDTEWTAPARRRENAWAAPDHRPHQSGRVLAYRILALNTEKAHNLKDKSLEVVRMARNLTKRDGRKHETEFGAEFEAAELLTLGLAYEKNRVSQAAPTARS